jgi:hypothetical protein
MRSSRWRSRSRLFILKRREDAAQRLQRFVHLEVFFEATYRRLNFELNGNTVYY